MLAECECKLKHLVKNKPLKNSNISFQCIPVGLNLFKKHCKCNIRHMDFLRGCIMCTCAFPDFCCPCMTWGNHTRKAWGSSSTQTYRCVHKPFCCTMCSFQVKMHTSNKHQVVNRHTHTKPAKQNEIFRRKSGWSTGHVTSTRNNRWAKIILDWRMNNENTMELLKMNLESETVPSRAIQPLYSNRDLSQKP